MFSATRLQSGVSTYTVLPSTATPRLPMCQPPFDRQVECQISRPLRASIAHTWSGIVTYITPLTTTGVPLIVGTAAPPPPAWPVPAFRRWTHPSDNAFTFELLIFDSVLKRRPE